ncbi:MAG: hypothetical protein V3V16_11850 [Melioribacteraceae bacterium]
MDKIIIGIHGLGNKPSKEILERWWIDAMCEGLKKIDKYEFVPKFELAYWADILNDKPLAEEITDKENLYFLDEKYVPEPEIIEPRDNSTRERILNFLEKQMDWIFLNDDLTSNFSAISDMVFKKYFKELDIYFTSKRDIPNEIVSIKNNIRNRLAEVIKKHEGKEILLLSHSMGTIIAFDVCSLMTTDINIDTFVTMGSPLGLPIVVSEIAEELKVNNPGLHKLSTPKNITRSWINYYDLEDSVAINYHLKDDYIENENKVKVQGINVVNNYEINDEKNPHKSYGYLRTPEFANLLSEFLVRDRTKLDLWVIKTKEKCVNIYKNLTGK